MTAHTPLIYQVTASSDVPTVERYEHWLRPLLSDFEAAPPSMQQRKNFQGQVTSLVTATSELHDMQSDDFEGFGPNREDRRYEEVKLALVYVMKGQVMGQHEGDTDTIAKTGQFFVFDGSRPNRIRFHKARFVQINVPRAHLQPLLSNNPAPSQLGSALACSGLAPLLATQLAQFRSLSGSLTTHERLGLLQATEALATTVLESACLGNRIPDSNHRLGLYTAAQRYIRLHLHAASLSASTIAAALGCSRATLYRAFEQHNLGIADHIRELRLQKLARLLQNPSNVLPIADLAHLCGLHDSPNLSRLFRQRFDLTPLGFRAMYRTE
ncbi:MAG: helix-turn-helix domain-containing protein [Candidimonas sp.]|nr:helix-turn-helix domain-containing protein [Candidimonas sp.]